MTGLRALLRLALRDARSRPWRSLLVVLLVAVPTAIAVFAATWLRTGIASPEEQVISRMGAADLVISAPNRDATARPVLASLPPGSRTIELHIDQALVASLSTGRKVRPSLWDLPLGDPVAKGLLAPITAGRPPRIEGEAAASRALLEKLGVAIGATVTPLRPARPIRITGAFERSLSWDVLAGPGITDRALPSEILVDLAPGAVGPPADADGSPVLTRESALATARAAASSNERLFLFAYAGLGMAAFALIVSSALAIGARRQLRTLGLLGASGGTPAQARALVLVQGLAFGVSGAVLGIALGLASAPLLRPAIERLRGNPERPISVPILDCVVIAVLAVVLTLAAAWLPARLAGRTRLLAALAGRRPQPRVAARVPIAGLLISAVGCAGIGWIVSQPRTNSDRAGFALVGAATLVVAGLALCAPALVALAERLAHRASGTARLAIRSVGRNRSRSAATAAAIMAAASLALATAGVTASSDRERQVEDARSWSPQGPVTAVVSGATWSGGRPVGVRCSDVSEVAGALNRALRRDGARCMEIVEGQLGADRVVAVEADVVGSLGLPRLREHLANGRAIWFPIPGFGADVPTTLVGRAPVQVIDWPTVPSGLEQQLYGAFLVSPATARRLGARVFPPQVVVAHPSDSRLIGDRERRSLEPLWNGDLGTQLSTADRSVQVLLNSLPSSPPTDLQFVAYAIVLPAAFVLALLACLVGLALTAAESREERALLAAVGAGPRHRRADAAWQAGLVAALGSVLAIPGGLVPAAVLVESVQDNIAFVMPWPMLLALGVGLPLVAAAIAALLANGRQDGVGRRLA